MRHAPPIVCAALLAATAARAGDKLDFGRDVRPILSNNCFLCHGPDDKQRQSKLRFDLQESAFAKLDDGGFAIVPGKPADSELLKRIRAHDADTKMPPAKTGKKLTDKEIAILERWISEGASWGKHWGFTTPTRPTVPQPQNAAWVRNPLDAFILDRLDREKLQPSPAAEKATLLRRLSLDLVGLPPTVAELDAFLADESPDAYAKQVERLLRSPHYGEKWARMWLDGARYADSDGFEKDKPRYVWMYRDWVTDAFNRDLPYDRFVIEQIAGDLLPGAGQSERVATGFLRNSMINEEGGVDPEQFRMEAMFDRMDAVGKSMLGLTIQCAQCHTHKYDPISHDEYYRMFAFLNCSSEGSINVYTADEQRTRAKIAKLIGDVEAKMQAERPTWKADLTAWEKSVVDRTKWQTMKPKLDESGGQKHTLLEDGSIFASGYAPTKMYSEFEADCDLPVVTAMRVELLTDADLPRGGPGRSLFGACVLSEAKLFAAPKDGSAKPREFKIAKAYADVNPPERLLQPNFDDKSKKRRVTGPIEYAIDGSHETGWGIELDPGRTNLSRHAVFVLAEPIAFPKGAVLTFKLWQYHGGWNSDDNQNNNFGRFRLSVTDATSNQFDPVPTEVRRLLDKPIEKRSALDTAAIFSHWRTTVPEWKLENAMIEALHAQHPLGASQLTMSDRHAMRPTHLLERGDFLKKKQTVKPGVPAVLHPMTDDKPDRLAFARWLVDRRSPTAARAFVNRVWQAYFGTGLVDTPEDFGSQGSTPSHPDLLDWLAVEFMDKGWSVKELHRLIANSNTYRQQSKTTPALLEKDPYNRLLARGPRFRVDGETVRDVALAASGLLSPKVGGPSVHPPAPDFLFQPPTSYGPKIWDEATGADRYRRALYTFRYRSVPYPMLQTFDAPNGDAACVRRSRTNSPLQALTLLNEPMFLECARALGRRALAETADDAKRIEQAFRWCTSRTPTAAERTALQAFLDKQKAKFAGKDSKPWELAADDPKHPPKLPANATPADAAAWTALGRVLLALDETIVKE